MRVEVIIKLDHGTYSAVAESNVGDTEAECLAYLMDQASHGAIAAAGFSRTMAEEILGCWKAKESKE